MHLNRRRGGCRRLLFAVFRGFFVFVVANVPGVFVFEGEIAEIRHTVEKESPVEVVGFMLNDCGSESFETFQLSLPATIQEFGIDDQTARGLAANSGNRKAPLPKRLRFLLGEGKRRVDDNQRVVFVSSAWAHDEEALGNENLGCGQTHASLLEHRFDHVVDPSLGRRGEKLGLGVGLGQLDEDRMTHARDFEVGHVFPPTNP